MTRSTQTFADPPPGGEGWVREARNRTQNPEGQNPGVNFGISLSLWDYVFKTAHVPEDSGTIQLGFDGIEDYPTSNFFRQLVSGFGKR